MGFIRRGWEVCICRIPRDRHQSTSQLNWLVEGTRLDLEFRSSEPIRTRDQTAVKEGEK